MSLISISIQHLDTDIEAPAYAYLGDAGLDLRTSQDIELAPFERVLIPTGIAIALPVGYAGFVLPRSGLAIKCGLSLVNSPGLIDSNYRGEIKIIAINLDPKQTIQLKRNDRVAQMVVIGIPEAVLITCDRLEESVRGSDGFGSSGV